MTRGRTEKKESNIVIRFSRRKDVVPCSERFVSCIDFSIYANISYMKDFLNTMNTVPPPKKTARRARLWVFWQLYLFKKRSHLRSSLKVGLLHVYSFAKWFHFKKNSETFNMSRIFLKFVHVHVKIEWYTFQGKLVNEKQIHRLMFAIDSPKFIVLYMEILHWWPTGWATIWWPETNRKTCHSVLLLGS